MRRHLAGPSLPSCPSANTWCPLPFWKSICAPRTGPAPRAALPWPQAFSCLRWSWARASPRPPWLAFLPNIKRAYDHRTSIAETLSATIASSGIDQAAKQYHELKAAAPATYNFDEDELNALGYQLILAHKVKQAIRIFQLNIEAYPRSGNTYDSLAEAYMDDGNKSQAIANYRKSLQLNPRNANAVQMLQKLNSP